MTVTFAGPVTFRPHRLGLDDDPDDLDEDDDEDDDDVDRSDDDEDDDDDVDEDDGDDDEPETWQVASAGTIPLKDEKSLTFRRLAA